jgi:hypothetical protein
MKTAALIGLLMTPSLALAHFKIDTPAPVNTLDANKTADAPCGPIPASPTVHVRQVGTQLQITWKETINHTGTFEIRYAPTGVAECTATNNGQATAAGKPDATNTQIATNKICPTLLTNPITDPNDVGINQADPATWKTYTQMVTLPGTPNSTGVIQMIQWMSGGTTYTPYFSCVRLNLSADPVDLAGGPMDLSQAPSDMAVGGTGSGDGGGTGGGTGDGGGNGGGGGGVGMFKNTGCAMGGRADLSAFGVLFVLAALAIAARRRSGPSRCRS